MAPKKKDDKKKKGGEDDEKGPLAAKAFTKQFPQECTDRGVDVLQLVLDRGEEGQAAFLRLAIHAGCCPNFVPLHIRALVAALLPYSYLQRLCFWSVAVRDEGCAALAQYLVANRTVATLEVTDCGVGPSGCKSLGEALERNATLTTLRLDHNVAIGVAGAQALGESLRVNKALVTLSMTFCGLEGVEGGKCVVSLMQAPILKVLELKSNRFGPDGVLLLLQALRTCGSLFRIDLADTGFDTLHPEVHAALEECFEQNNVCCEYALAGNDIGDSCAYRWLGMIRKLPHLIYVDVTNRLDPLLFKQIGDATAANKKEWLKQQKKKGKKGGKKKK